MKEATHQSRLGYQLGERGQEAYPRGLLRAGAYDSLKAGSVFAGQGCGSSEVTGTNESNVIKSSSPLKDIARRLLQPLEGAINMLDEVVDILNEGADRVRNVELVRGANIEASWVDGDAIERCRGLGVEQG